MTVVGLTAVDPYWIGIFNGILRGRKWTGVIIGHRNAETTVRAIDKACMRNTHNPESNPFGAISQGLSNVDWVTVWLCCSKVNKTTSPTAAFCVSRSQHIYELAFRIEDIPQWTE